MLPLCWKYMTPTFNASVPLKYSENCQKRKQMKEWLSEQFLRKY